MPSRSLSPPRRRRRGADADHRAEPSMIRSYLRPRRPSNTGRRAASMPVLPGSPAHVSPDRPPSAPPPPRSYASVVHPGHLTPPHPQHQEESGSESELDSSPYLVIISDPEDQEPGSPTSPHGSPPSTYIKPAVLPKGSILGSVAEERHTLDGEDDPYFKSLVENFVIAAADVDEYPLSEDDIERKAGHQRQSDEYAECALKHYNNDEKNKVKYELVRAITSCAIMESRGCYGHVNFIAKENQQNSKEELFFGEVRWDSETCVTTCVLSLKGVKEVGGLCDTRYDGIFDGMGLPMDAQHCYACLSNLKHPKDGEVYETGHVAASDYYHG